MAIFSDLATSLALVSLTASEKLFSVARMCTNIGDEKTSLLNTHMPAKSSWWLKIPEIVLALSAMQVPVVDRKTFERLFGVRRRRAMQLAQQFGGYRAGNTSLVDRLALIDNLRRLEADPDVIFEQRRKQKISDELEEVRRHSKAATVLIQALPAARHGTQWTLPSGVQIADGKLTVGFASVEELMARLYGLAQAAAADFERFCETVTRL
jgi:hypothetical protein